LLFIEQIAELVLAELRRAEDQVHARELRDLGPLARIEEQERTVWRPRHAGRIAVGQEAPA
jgi:hypothetical protein